MYVKNPLTENEFAAVVYHVTENCDNWHTLYMIARGPKSLNKLTQLSINSTISKFKNDPDIKQAIKQYRKEYETKKKAIIQEYIQNQDPETINAQKENQGEKNINFLNPDEFLQFANLQANKITDEKERREYLKIIANLMNYKEGDDENSEQIKAYLPQNCENCELYKRCKVCKLDVCPVELG